MKIQQSAIIHLDAPIGEVFPLFGPVREKDWAHGWDPEIIFPKDAVVAKHMVFRTRGGLHGTDEQYTWVIINYEPEEFMIEYLVSASERFWVITVECRSVDMRTSATVTYSYTGFNPDAHEKNMKAIGSIFSCDLKDWEDAVNDYINKP